MKEIEISIDNAPRRKRRRGVVAPYIPIKRRILTPYIPEPAHPNNPTKFPRRKAA